VVTAKSQEKTNTETLKFKKETKTLTTVSRLQQTKNIVLRTVIYLRRTLKIMLCIPQ